LQAEFAANREVLASKRERWRAKRAEKQKRFFDNHAISDILLAAPQA
jgi:hypothetical protein